MLFWSGGKDSWLALDAILAEATVDAFPDAAHSTTACETTVEPHQPGPLLLTTFDAQTGDIPFQGFSFNVAVQQARHLQRDLLLVPLPPRCSNDVYVDTVLGALTGDAAAAVGLSVARLVFGDLHLDEVRRWREEQFSPSLLECHFPLFEQPYERLLARLWRAQDAGELTVDVSAIADEAAVGAALHVGGAFDRASVAELVRSSCDAMGEGGEFHTRVSFPSCMNE